MTQKKKTTFVLDTFLLKEAKGIINQKGYKSLNNFVEEAIKRAILEEKTKQRLKEIEEAATDSLFLKDIEETMSAFSLLDIESLK